MKQLVQIMMATSCFIFYSFNVAAQILDFSNRVTVILNDGTDVTLYGAARMQDTLLSNEYYYLPTHLRLSQKPDGTPQFLFMKYTSEQRADADGTSGALMHFLMEWGLTPQQEKELQAKLATRVKDMTQNNPSFKTIASPKVVGAANVVTDEENSFSIISAVLSNNKSTPVLVTSGRAPVIPGGKVAVAAILEKNAAQLLAASFEKSRSITDVSLALRYRYNVLMPAVQGSITVNWQRVDSVFQHYKRNAMHLDGGRKGTSDDYVSDRELDALFSIMNETKAVDVRIVNLAPESEAAKQMVSTFMEYFLSTVSEKKAIKPEESTNTQTASPKEYKYIYRYYLIDRKRLEQKILRKTETYNLNVRLPITLELELVENLTSWYDAVRHNPKCVNIVNLNDPFFEHRDIFLILDLDAEEMFGKELNFVTVDIRKRRELEGANDFSKQVTFDKKYFEKEGNRTVVTYSKAQDEKPDLFEYRVKWSLRGGNIYEQDTTWTQGSWEGVALYPPVLPARIRFEADLEDFKNLDIRNVALQLRYYKFGKEVQTNLNINTSSGIGYSENTIYMDKNTQGYAYRLVFYHKNKGPLATSWDALLNTGYIYAVIPEEFRQGREDFINKMIELGKEVLSTPNGQEVKTGKVLDKFKDLIIIN